MTKVAEKQKEERKATYKLSQDPKNWTPLDYLTKGTMITLQQLVEFDLFNKFMYYDPLSKVEEKSLTPGFKIVKGKFIRHEEFVVQHDGWICWRAQQFTDFIDSKDGRFMSAMYIEDWTRWLFYLYIRGEKNIQPSPFGRGLNPVVNISYTDIISYINWLNFFENYEEKDTYYNIGEQVFLYDDVTNKGNRIPTIEQWRALVGDLPDVIKKEGSLDYAWTSENSDNHTHLVGTLKPNKFNVYDVAGNVWKGVLDN